MLLQKPHSFQQDNPFWELFFTLVMLPIERKQGSSNSACSIVVRRPCTFPLSHMCSASISISSQSRMQELLADNKLARVSF